MGVLSISVSKTGKHGHAKCNFTAVDIFTGKKLEDMIPSTHGTWVPIVNRADWEIIDIDGDELTLMDEAGNQKTDLNLPTYPEKMADEIRDAWADGENTVQVTVQAAVASNRSSSGRRLMDNSELSRCDSDYITGKRGDDRVNLGHFFCISIEKKLMDILTRVTRMCRSVKSFVGWDFLAGVS